MCPEISLSFAPTEKALRARKSEMKTIYTGVTLILLYFV